MATDSGGDQGGTAERVAPARIFMSYRRTDDPNFIGRFHDKLVDAFGEENVFRDLDSLHAGSPFERTIRQQIPTMDAVVAMIGPSWAARLHQPGDFVRMELVEALTVGRPIIPILIENTPFPDLSDLDEELRPIQGLNAVNVRRDPDFHRDMQRALEGIRRSVANFRAQQAELERQAAEREAQRVAVEQRMAEERARLEAEHRRSQQLAELARAEEEEAEARRRAAQVLQDRLKAEAEIQRLHDEALARKLAEERANLEKLSAEHARAEAARNEAARRAALARAAIEQEQPVIAARTPETHAPAPPPPPALPPPIERAQGKAAGDVSVVRLRNRIAAISAVLVVVVGLVVLVNNWDGSRTNGETGPDSTESESNETAESVPANSPKIVATTNGPSTTIRKTATSMEDWTQIWAAERAATVKKIRENKWGTAPDGKTVTGPEGFTIDLSACPSDWRNEEGLSDTEIKIGHTTALSGTLADYGNISKGMAVYFKAQPPIADSTGKSRTINLIVRDDGYDSNRTVPLVDEFLVSEKVFAMWTLGSPNTMKTYDTINKACVPQPLSMSGHAAWGDPVKHPWTTGMQMAYNTEGLMWGAFVDQRFSELAAGDGKVTVAALVMNNDFGKAYDAGFTSYLNTSANKANIEYVTESIEPSAPTVSTPMATLASKNPDLFIAMIGGNSCTLSILAASENGMNESAKFLFMPSVCKSSSFVSREKVGGDGSVADGWWIIGGGVKDLNGAEYDTDPFVVYGRELLAAAGLDVRSSGSFGSGYFFAWSIDQALRIAAELEGGLARSNLIVALRSMELTHPLLLDGVKFNMNGNKDAYLIEGSDLARYDAAAQAWIQQGPVVDVSGKTPNCSWNLTVAKCD